MKPLYYLLLYINLFLFIQTGCFHFAPGSYSSLHGLKQFNAADEKTDTQAENFTNLAEEIVAQKKISHLFLGNNKKHQKLESISGLDALLGTSPDTGPSVLADFLSSELQVKLHRTYLIKKSNC